METGGDKGKDSIMVLQIFLPISKTWLTMIFLYTVQVSQKKKKKRKKVLKVFNINIEKSLTSIMQKLITAIPWTYSINPILKK